METWLPDDDEKLNVDTVYRDENAFPGLAASFVPVADKRVQPAPEGAISFDELRRRQEEATRKEEIARGKPPPPATTAPPSPNAPMRYSFEELQKRQRDAEANKAAPNTGIIPNVAAGLAEGSTPGLISGLASPVDVPVNLARELYGSGSRLGLTARGIAREFTDHPYTDAEYLKERQALDERNPIPESPATKWLTGLAHTYLGAPTPEHPIETIAPGTPTEEKLRRGSQVGSQVASTILGARGLRPIMPYVPPGSAPPMTTGKLVSNLATAAPKFLAMPPPTTAGLIAGGSNYLGQSSNEYLKGQGYSDASADLAQKAVELGSNLGLSVGTAGVSALSTPRAGQSPNALNTAASALTAVPRALSRYGDQLVSGLGNALPLRTAAKEATDRLAAEQLRKSAVSPLAVESDWQKSDVNVGDQLRNQVAAKEASATSTQQAEQALADRARSQFTLGGTATDLTNRITDQTAQLTPHVEGMRFAPEDVGQRLRDSAGSQRKGGIVDEILAKDANGNPVLPHSEIPSKVFNPNLTPEDLSNLLWRSKGEFRQAFRDAGLSDFENAAVRRDPSGNKTGTIDLSEGQKWLDKHSDLLDAYERQTAKLWGKPDTSIREGVATATSKQQALDNLNLQRDQLLGVVRTGGRNADAATLWKPGASGGQSVREYVATKGSGPEAIDNMMDIAAASLRKAAEKNGTWDTAAARKWMSEHQDAINELPPTARRNFDNATTAQELVDTNTAKRAQDIEDFKTGAAKHYLDGLTPEQAVQKVFSDQTRTPETAFKELVAKIGNDKPALDGLRRDFMKYGIKNAQIEAQDAINAGLPQGKFSAIANVLKEVIPGMKGTPKAFNDNSIHFMNGMSKFVEQNEGSIRALYGDAAADGMKKLLSQHPGITKPGGSVGELFLGLAMGGENLVGLLPLAGEVKLAVGAGLTANAALRRLRASGIRNANDLIPKAMEDPQLMRALTDPANKPGALTRAMQRLSVIGTEESMGHYGMTEDPKNKQYKPPAMGYSYKPPAIPGVTGR